MKNQSLKAKRQILASQVANKRGLNNEKAMTRDIAKLFKQVSEEVQKNLEEYWSDYQLLQGQINLITKPILDAEEEYNSILEKYIRRQYRLGSSEAERIVQNLTDNASMKAIDLQGIRAKIKKQSNQLFGTLQDAEDELLEKTFTASKRTLARVTSQINQIEYTQWIAADDDRTRDSHAEVDGEIIPIGSKYSNGLEYPGDTNGPLEEWINCRCSNAPFVVPYGYMAPSFSPFRESDLVPINTKSS